MNPFKYKNDFNTDSRVLERVSKSFQGGAVDALINKGQLGLIPITVTLNDVGKSPASVRRWITFKDAMNISQKTMQDIDTTATDPVNTPVTTDKVIAVPTDYDIPSSDDLYNVYDTTDRYIERDAIDYEPDETIDFEPYKEANPYVEYKTLFPDDELTEEEFYEEYRHKNQDWLYDKVKGWYKNPYYYYY